MGVVSVSYVLNLMERQRYKRLQRKAHCVSRHGAPTRCGRMAHLTARHIQQRHVATTLPHPKLIQGIRYYNTIDIHFTG